MSSFFMSLHLPQSTCTSTLYLGVHVPPHSTSEYMYLHTLPQSTCTSTLYLRVHVPPHYMRAWKVLVRLCRHVRTFTGHVCGKYWNLISLLILSWPFWGPKKAPSQFKNKLYFPKLSIDFQFLAKMQVLTRIFWIKQSSCTYICQNDQCRFWSKWTYTFYFKFQV